MRWSKQELTQPLFADMGLAGTGTASTGLAGTGLAGTGTEEEAKNSGVTQASSTAPSIPLLAGLVKSVQTPEFAGITFHEVLAKSALNKVPATSTMPFEWTINPYRGCSHACVYCFARKSHTYLDFDPGIDFDSQVVVKVNVAQVLKKELHRPAWKHSHVALGTNTDPYQRAEGRYKLMPGIIRALADSGTPFSILTKGTLLARDIPLLAEAAQHVSIGMGISLALLDEKLAAAIEPGTPTPKARLSLIKKLRDAGLPCGVMSMPILPWLSDSEESLDTLFAALAQAGATDVSAGALYLRPGTSQWFMAWLAREHPALVGSYQRLYSQGSYASKDYRQWLAVRISDAKRRHGFAGTTGFIHDPRREEANYPVGSIPTAHQSAGTTKAAKAGIAKAGDAVRAPAFASTSRSAHSTPQAVLF